MTRHEFYEAVYPAMEKWMDAFRKCDAAHIITHAYEISFINEVMWRIAYDAHDEVQEDIPWLDVLARHPDKFVSYLADTAVDDDYSGEIFVPVQNRANEYYEGMIRRISSRFAIDEKEDKEKENAET